jgi:exosortase
MFQGYSMILGLFGLALFLLGPRKIRLLWFPILYLALGVKISDRLWEKIAWYLQQIAAHAATIGLQLIGFDASVDGATIDLTISRNGRWVTEALDVAEACSGLRMLMAFVALGAAIAYLLERPWWHRLIMLALTVPIAVCVNVIRVITLGILFVYKPEMAQGDFHVFIGMLMLLPAAALFLLLGWILDHLVTQDQTPSESPGENTPGSIAIGPAHPPADTASPTRLVGPDWPWLLKGVAIGSAMAAVIGIQYGLTLAIWRPDAVFQGQLTSSVIHALYVTGFLMLIGIMWLLYRWVALEKKNEGLALGVPLGLVSGVLLVAVLSLGGVVQATQTVLIKQPVPMREPLWPLPKQIGTWVMIREDPRLSREELEVLGTEQYVSRLYMDAAKPENSPGSIIRLHTAYYTGTPDTVPHVPERCFVAGGLVPIAVGPTTLKLSGPQYSQHENTWVDASRLNPQGARMPTLDIAATAFTYSVGKTDRPEAKSNVIYFFAANGKFLSTPDLVRLQGFDPRDRYSYYCKIEVGVFGVGDLEQANLCVSGFLSVMLPEVMACLPDWVDVTQGRWPATASQTRSSALQER